MDSAVLRPEPKFHTLPLGPGGGLTVLGKAEGTVALTARTDRVDHASFQASLTLFQRLQQLAAIRFRGVAGLLMPAEGVNVIKLDSSDGFVRALIRLGDYLAYVTLTPQLSAKFIRWRRRMAAARGAIADGTVGGFARARDAMADRQNQVTAISAVGGAMAAGVGGGAAGLAMGGSVGAAVGLIPALFTFGLSIPICAAVGGALGAGGGAAAGAAAGAVGGGATGYKAYERYRHARGGA